MEARLVKGRDDSLISHGEVPISNYLLLNTCHYLPQLTTTYHNLPQLTTAYHGEVPICGGRRAVEPHMPDAQAAQVRLQAWAWVQVQVRV